MRTGVLHLQQPEVCRGGLRTVEGHLTRGTHRAAIARGRLPPLVVVQR
jgi:hypothetical protein